jgi:hypothetical protein
MSQITCIDDKSRLQIYIFSPPYQQSFIDHLYFLSPIDYLRHFVSSAHYLLYLLSLVYIGLSHLLEDGLSGSAEHEFREGNGAGGATDEFHGVDHHSLGEGEFH